MRSGKAMLGAGLMLAVGAAAAAGPEFDWLAGQWCGGNAERRVAGLVEERAGDGVDAEHGGEIRGQAGGLAGPGWLGRGRLALRERGEDAFEVGGAVGVADNVGPPGDDDLAEVADAAEEVEQAGLGL